MEYLVNRRYDVEWSNLGESSPLNLTRYLHIAHNADNFWIGRKKMFEDIERIIVETEEGEEIATIINDDEIDEAIIVANGYTVRIKPKAN